MRSTLESARPMNRGGARNNTSVNAGRWKGRVLRGTKPDESPTLRGSLLPPGVAGDARAAAFRAALRRVKRSTRRNSAQHNAGRRGSTDASPADAGPACAFCTRTQNEHMDCKQRLGRPRLWARGQLVCRIFLKAVTDFDRKNGPQSGTGNRSALCDGGRREDRFLTPKGGPFLTLKLAPRNEQNRGATQRFVWPGEYFSLEEVRQGCALRSRKSAPAARHVFLARA